MNLATRCPACSTTFKVVTDQLRVSDGWVRCGRCSRVFDANEQMVDPARPVGVEAHAVEALDDDLPWTSPPVTGTSWERLPSLDLGGSFGELKKGEPFGPAADVEATLPQPFVSEAQAIGRNGPTAVVKDGAAHERLDEGVGETNAPFIVRMPSESSGATAERDRPDPPAVEPGVSFAGDRAGMRRRTGWRIALFALVLVALLVLAAQVLARSHDVGVACQSARLPLIAGHRFDSFRA
jgi:predicted Zn finger-like uncharacterized protein